MKTHLQDLLAAALAKTLAAFNADAQASIQLDPTKDAKFGDFQTNLAMQLAKPLGKPPRAIAELLIANLPASPQLEKAEIAGPGFINFFLAKTAVQAVVSEVLTQRERYGLSTEASGKHVLIEFVSANPTGPLHVGHGRQAALGDALSNLLQTQGWAVHREYYYNDAGVQIATLATSVQARARGHKPGDAAWPASAYNGDYIADIAADFLAKKTVAASDGEPATGSGDVDDLDSIRRFAVAYLRREQDIDLQTFGVHFDQYYLESSLYTEGKVEQTVNALIAAGRRAVAAHHRLR
jgi:arginyl-tRNA synthetase